MWWMPWVDDTPDRNPSRQVDSKVNQLLAPLINFYLCQFFICQKNPCKFSLLRENERGKKSRKVSAGHTHGFWWQATDWIGGIAKNLFSTQTGVVDSHSVAIASWCPISCENVMQRCLYVQVLSISVYLILERPAEAGYVVYALMQLPPRLLMMRQPSSCWERHRSTGSTTHVFGTGRGPWLCERRDIQHI